MTQPVPSIVMVTDDRFGDPDRVSRRLQLGSIAQGTTEYGRLRDKDVSHANVTGFLHCGSSYLDQTYPGKLVSFWGEDLYWSYTGSPSPHQAVGDPLRGITSFGGAPTVSMSLRYSGDYAVQITKWTGLNWSYSKSKVLGVNPPAHAIRFFQRTAGTGGRVNVSATYWSTTVNGKLCWSLPAGPVNVESDILVIPKGYGVLVNGSITTQKTALDLEGGTSELYADQIAADLQSGRFDMAAFRVFQASPDEPDPGALGEDVLRSLRYVDTSLLLTVFDLVRSPDELKSWNNLVKAFRKIAKTSTRILYQNTSQRIFWEMKRLGKLGSSAYLGREYGILPNVRDIVRLITGIRELHNFAQVPQRLHARRTTAVPGPGSPIVTTSTLTLQVGSVPDGLLGDLTAFIREGKRWGVWPSLPMLWDAVPYSFVIDHVINVSKTFREMWDRNDALYFGVLYHIASVKRVWQPDPRTIWPAYMRVTGQVRFTHYTRSVAKGFPLPPSVQVHVEVESVGSFWLQAGALVFQRWK